MRWSFKLIAVGIGLWILAIFPIKGFGAAGDLNVDIEPETLNLKSGGKWITCYIEWPKGDLRTVSPKEISLIAVNDKPLGKDSIPAESDPKYDFVKDPKLEDRDGDKVPELMVKFDRGKVQALCKVPLTKLTVGWRIGPPPSGIRLDPFSVPSGSAFTLGTFDLTSLNYLNLGAATSGEDARIFIRIVASGRTFYTAVTATEEPMSVSLPSLEDPTDITVSIFTFSPSGTTVEFTGASFTEREELFDPEAGGEEVSGSDTIKIIGKS